ncbi:hypothetical protein Vretifemale_5668 [Volvox reticuliferus]|uniref:Uncharacterized protein n=1 Tax=Volvox reticuliferus TaxID=1737510 RepID=A0A8J4C8F0_9CHLO|nr:hypothetical protein Vretifemale_5668 [Volvox reticuliferus]
MTPSTCVYHQFLAAPGSRHAVLEHQDDMLWFVAARDSLSPNAPNVWLRRNTSAELPTELRPGGSAFSSVDWTASAQLNLVVQAKYILTVVQCRQDCLAAIAQDHANPGPCTVGNHRQQPDVVIAQRRVYASPMAADVNLEEAKSGQSPQACYPDVCFAVDNYEDAFQDVILSRHDDCYCVMLHVHSSRGVSTGNAILLGSGPVQSERALASSSAPTQASQQVHDGERRAVLFSAYVTQEQVNAFITAHKLETSKTSLLNRFLGALREGDAKVHRQKVTMIGPGSLGRAEALAAAAPASSKTDAAAAGRVETALQMSLLWLSLPAAALAQAILRFACADHL